MAEVSNEMMFRGPSSSLFPVSALSSSEIELSMVRTKKSSTTTRLTKTTYGFDVRSHGNSCPGGSLPSVPYLHALQKRDHSVSESLNSAVEHALIKKKLLNPILTKGRGNQQLRVRNASSSSSYGSSGNGDRLNGVDSLKERAKLLFRSPRSVRDVERDSRVKQRDQPDMKSQEEQRSYSWTQGRQNELISDMQSPSEDRSNDAMVVSLIENDDYGDKYSDCSTEDRYSVSSSNVRRTSVMGYNTDKVRATEYVSGDGTNRTSTGAGLVQNAKKLPEDLCFLRHPMSSPLLEKNSSIGLDDPQHVFPQIRLEAAEEGEGGVELVMSISQRKKKGDADDTHSVSGSVLLERERQLYKQKWFAEREDVDKNDAHVDVQIVGMEFHASSTLQDCDEISDFPSSTCDDPVALAAVRAVSLLLHRESHYDSGLATVHSIHSRSGEEMEPEHDEGNGGPLVRALFPEGEEKAQEPDGVALVPPCESLAKLIRATQRTDGNDVDLSEAVRRKNACGALKVMSARPENRKRLARTIGVLPAMTRSLQYNDQHHHRHNYHNSIVHGGGIPALMEADNAARARASAVLYNLLGLPENRAILFRSPGLFESMVAVALHDRSEARQTVCACFAQMARTKALRLPMAQFSGLLSSFQTIISVHADRDVETDVDVEVAEHDDDIKSSSSSSTPTISNSTYQSNLNGNEEGTSIWSRGTISTYGDRYDRCNRPHLNGARAHVFACTLALVKDRDAASVLVRNEPFLSHILDVSCRFDSAAHVRCVAVVAHLTRLDGPDGRRMVFRVRRLLGTLVQVAAHSLDSGCRRYACLALQNLSADRACRQEIAYVPGLVTTLCRCVANAATGCPEERLAAARTLCHLADEPANLVSITSASGDAMAILAGLATDPTMISGPPTFNNHSTGVVRTNLYMTENQRKLQYYACDILATLSHWLTLVALSKSPSMSSSLTTHDLGRCQFLEDKRSVNVYKPTLRVHGWNQWE